MIRLFAALAVFALVLAGPADAHDTGQLHFHGNQLSHDTGALHFHGDELSQYKAQMCFHNCIEQNGTTAKQSCALQCDVAKGPGMGGQQRDCGTEFKNCRKACAGNKDCFENCRTARKQCY
ncbi:MAG: hypothetical protein VW268_10565 [Rhodospirillaceae bacterium]